MSKADKQTQLKLRVRPFVLIIRDGWGYNIDPELQKYDATRLANTPVDDRLRNEYGNCLISASGEDVGLPKGTMGNSEVGHQNIGAGRIVNQESMRLTQAVRDGSFYKNEVLLKAVANCKDNHGKLHLIGLASDIGVHSLLGHLYGLLELCKRNNFDKVFLHALMDGRDSPPMSGKGYIEQIESKMAEIGAGKVASVMGRFYGMDRDHRWERVEKAYQCWRYGKGTKGHSAREIIQGSYDKEVTDEFVNPSLVVGEDDQPLALIEDGD
jgi:2,3-bisphosphoglycerate-independent phosphoglycerate mutase